MRAHGFVLSAFFVCACAAHRPEPTTSEPRTETRKPAVKPPVAPKPRHSDFALGCEIDAKGAHPPRTELTRDPGARWLWACRAVALLGAPRARESGYPDFRVRDTVSGACMTLSIEDVGAFIYHAPEGRAEALKSALEAQSNPVPDCSFQLGTKKAGLRSGAPFEEALYDLETVDGALAFFRAQPSADSAAGFLSRYLVLDSKARPKDLDDVLERALALELDAFDEMQVAWLSPVGKQGYCERSRQLTKLPVSATSAQRVAGQVKRFCKP